jgi:hypothetical protein
LLIFLFWLRSDRLCLSQANPPIYLV